VRRGNDELELPELVGLHVHRAVGADVGFDPLEHPEAPLVLRVERVDGGVLPGRLRHRHPAGDRQPVGVIRNPGAALAAREARVGDRVERFGAVAPDGVHLEVAAVLLTGGSAAAREDVANGGAAEEMLPQRPQLCNLLLLACLAHCALDERGPAVVNQLAREAIGGGADTGHRLECVGLDERRDVPVEAQDGLCGALIPPAALAVAGERGHVEQQPGELEIDIAHMTPWRQAAVPSRIIISIHVS
jgi:hypothetical protein